MNENSRNLVLWYARQGKKHAVLCNLFIDMLMDMSLEGKDDSDPMYRELRKLMREQGQMCEQYGVLILEIQQKEGW